MRVEAIKPRNIYRANSSRKINEQNIRSSFAAQADTVSFTPRLARLTFTGIDRNIKQIASLAYENNKTNCVAGIRK